MPLIETHKLQPGSVPFQDQVYNALDTCVTLEVHEELSKLPNDPSTELIYSFERALQAPAMEMMLRGFRIDDYERQRNIAQLRAEHTQVYSALQKLAYAVWDRELNPSSPKQLQGFFFGAMRYPEIWTSKKGVKKLSMDREALEKLDDRYFHARPFVQLILACREISNQLNVLETQTENGRMFTSYNVAATETGRWSSSASSTGSGTNLQNISPPLRKMFVADPGYKLCNIDLEQTESFDVGWLQGTLFGDWTYLDACERGDLHTQVARMVWAKQLPWTGELKADRKIADQIFYRHFSYRDMAKRGGHLTNYYGTAWTAAKHLKVPIKLMEDFQNLYAHGQEPAFPGFAKWWQWTAQQLQTSQELITPMGRKRHFFGRPRDDATLREAIAFIPQSTTADRMNLGLWRMWKHMGQRIQLLGQVHDSVVFQYPESADEAELLAEALSYTAVPLRDARSGRSMTVKAEAKIGWNWANWSESNPDGLKKFSASSPDLRERCKVRIL